MGTGRKFNNKSRTRPSKKPAERRRREKAQKKRLEQLGVPAEKADKLTAVELRQRLRQLAKSGSAG